jgi:hypothetical protein
MQTKKMVAFFSLSILPHSRGPGLSVNTKRCPLPQPACLLEVRGDRRGGADAELSGGELRVWECGEEKDRMNIGRE